MKSLAEISQEAFYLEWSKPVTDYNGHTDRCIAAAARAIEQEVLRRAVEVARLHATPYDLIGYEMVPRGQAAEEIAAAILALGKAGEEGK